MAHPDAPFYKDKTTLEGSYRDGYSTGYTWTDSYRPGGPWVPRDGFSNDPDWIAYCNHKAACNREYLRGFDEGLVKQLKRKRKA